MKRQISAVACLLLALLLLSGTAVFAAVPEGGDAAVWIEEPTVTAGNSFSFYIKARALDQVGTLSLSLYYDETQFEFSAVTAQSLISGEITSVNSKTPGVLGLDFISLDGVTGEGNLWRVTLKAKSTATAGKHPLVLAVGEAYTAALAPLSVAAGSGNVTVNAPAAPSKSVSFYLNRSVSSLTEGGGTVITLGSSNLNGLAAAEFEISYDPALLRLDGVTLGQKLTGAENAVYTVNDKTPGIATVSYVAIDGLTGSASPVFSLQFTAICNLDTQTAVKITPKNLYGADLSAMTASAATTTLSLYKTEAVVDLPDVTLGGYEGLEEFSLELTVPKELELAAADFVFTFDPEAVIATSVERLDASHLLFHSIDNEKGKITVSFIDEDGVSETGAILRLTFAPGEKGGDAAIAFLGKHLVNAELSPVAADFVSAPVVIHKHGGAMNAEGEELCAVSGCGKSLAKFGHSTVFHAAKEPACTDGGWDAYRTCSACGYTDYAEREALGHRILVGGTVLVDSVTEQNDARYPFLLEDGIYSSTNKDHSTDSYFTLTALYGCTVHLSYAVSSETNYDKLILRKNGTAFVTVSGEVDWASQEITLAAGDVLTFNYHKDGSVSTLKDTAYFSFSCTKTEIDSRVPAPAEDGVPTCTEAVVCHYCEAVVKEALGHDEVHHGAKAPTCTEIGWDAYVTCSRCDYGTPYVEKEATGHDFGEWTVISPVLNEGTAKVKRVCKNDPTHVETETRTAPRVTGATLNISSDVSIKYTVTLPEGFTDAYAVFDFNGKQYTVKNYTEGGAGKYVFAFTGITPQCLGDEVVITAYAEVDGLVLAAVKDNYSVRTYCESQLKKAASNTKLVTLISDLLTYGARSQIYMNYKTDALVTEGLTLTPSTFAALDASYNKKALVGEKDAETYWKSVGLRYENAMAMYFRFYAEDVEGLSVCVTVNGRTKTFTEESFKAEGGGVYRIDFRGITATEFDSTVSASFVRNGSAVGQTAQYSVNTYVVLNQNSANASLAELLRATYNYGVASEVYTAK